MAAMMLHQVLDFRQDDDGRWQAGFEHERDGFIIIASADSRTECVRAIFQLLNSRRVPAPTGAKPGSSNLNLKP
jgi:hypothetical protein